MLSRLRDSASGAPLPLRIVFWDGEAFDFAPEPTVTLTLRSRALMRLFITGRVDRLGDAYASGDLAVDGPVEDILQTGVAIAERIGKYARFAGWMSWARRFRHSPRNDAAAISYHYDVPTGFYQLWLDPELTYSCAYFEHGDESIEAAQSKKLDHICRKLQLRPGERLLDIGCGWGALVRHAAQRYGVIATGITNSVAQSEFAREIIASNGLTDRVDIRHCDYRDLDEACLYDKVVSVGMYEHVGMANLQHYFELIARLLRPGGVLLNHGIISTDARGKAQGPPGGEFIDKHVFPGGELPNLPQALRRILQSGLEPTDIEDLRPHYARTLLLWLRRLEARSGEAIESAGAERYRIWRMFLAGMAHAFDQGWLSVAQIVAYKPDSGRPADRPWTRRHQYDADDAAAVSRALDWKGA